jgi:hypothetical protein
MNLEDNQALLREFLERWPESAVATMTLPEYVGLKDKDTFTQWVETKTRPLGSIKGAYSDKFGIYRRNKPEKRSKNRENDEQYTWMKRFGKNREEAFDAVRQDILKIIEFAQSGDFEKLDLLQLPNLFKWKVASLYSNERLVPIFKEEALARIAETFGLTASPKTNTSAIHEVLVNHKPSGQDIYSYMEALYAKYGTEHHKEIPATQPQTGRSRKARGTRKGATTKNVTPQLRNPGRSYIAEMKHNKLQLALRQKLMDEYGEAAVPLEENWVDVKVSLPNEIVFYEVKSASYASDCIEEALGQILGYLFTDKDTRKKRIVVVGQYPPNESDQDFIVYLKSLLKIDFSYEHIDI